MKTVSTSKMMCYGCGFCKPICPVKAVKFHEDNFSKNNKSFSHAYIDEKKCIECNLCHEICPSKGWRKSYIMKNQSIKEITKALQPFEELCFCHSTNKNIRRKGTSGGMATAILVYLLEKGVVEGVLMPSYDNLLGAKYKIIKTKEEIIQNQKSKYFCIPFDVSFDEIKKYKSLAFIGLPCHLESLTNVFKKKPKLSKIINFKITLFCAHVQNKIFYSHLLKKQKINPDELKRLDFRPDDWWNCDYFKIETNSKVETFPFRNDRYNALMIISNIFSRDACRFCPDFSGRNSDISLGDGWHNKLKGNKEGYNYAIIRTSFANKILNEMLKDKKIKKHPSNFLEFSKSNLINILKSKQYRIKERRTYLRKKDKEALKNFKYKSGFKNTLKTATYFKIKRFANFLQRKNILHKIPFLAYYLASAAIVLKNDFSVVTEYLLKKLKLKK